MARFLCHNGQFIQFSKLRGQHNRNATSVTSHELLGSRWGRAAAKARAGGKAAEKVAAKAAAKVVAAKAEAERRAVAKAAAARGAALARAPPSPPEMSRKSTGVSRLPSFVDHAFSKKVKSFFQILIYEWEISEFYDKNATN